MSFVKYCPICGRGVPDGVSLVAAPGIPDDLVHRCDPASLRGIDATLGVEERAPREPSFNERLAAGFAALGVG